MENRRNGTRDTLSIPPKIFESVSMTAISNSRERSVIKFCTEKDITALSSTAIKSSTPTLN